jgi:small subunit ribosomal protein S1
MKKIVEVPEGANTAFDEEREKIAVYQVLNESLESATKSKKKFITCKVLGAKHNMNGSTPEYRVCAMCQYKDWIILVKADQMGFNPKEFEGLNNQQKEAKYAKFISNMTFSTINVVIIGIDVKTKRAAGNRNMAMEYIKDRYYFKSDSNGKSAMEKIFESKKEVFPQARVVTVSKSVVWLEVFGLLTDVYARDVEWRFVENLKSVISVGDLVPVKIMELTIDKENKKVKMRVSIKEAKENMMIRNMQYYNEGDTLAGTVSNIQNGACYVQIGDFKTGIDVLCKIINLDEVPNKKDIVLVTIGKKDNETGRVFGRIEEIRKRASNY